MSLNSLNSRLGANAVALQLPIGAEDTFEGVIDLLKMKAIYFDGAEGIDVIEKEIPAEYVDQAEEYHQTLLEAAASFDDDLMMQILEGENLQSKMLKLLSVRVQSLLNYSQFFVVLLTKIRVFSQCLSCN